MIYEAIKRSMFRTKALPHHDSDNDIEQCKGRIKRRRRKKLERERENRNVQTGGKNAYTLQIVNSS